MEDELVYFSGEVKALGGGRIGGVLVRMTTNNDPDLTNDFFDVKSEVRFPGEIDVYYNHGMDETIKKRVIGRAKLSRLDNADVWAETQLNMRDDYEKRIYEMAEAGKLGYSSGALSHLVEREPVGKSFHIKTWVIGEASLTPTPAEYRNTVQTIKSLTKETIMDAVLDNTVDVKSEVAEAVKAALAIRDAELKAEADKQAAIEAAEDVGYQKAIEELKTRKAPAFNQITELGFSEEKDAVPAFKHWLGTGQVNDGLIRPDSVMNGIKSAFNAGVTSGPTGGYLVPDPLYNQIIEKRDNASFIRQLPVTYIATASDHVLVPVEDTSATAFVATAELAAYDENEPTVAQKDLILYKYTKEVQVTEEFIQYNAVNFDSFLTSILARAEATLENTLYLTGTGTGEALGVMATGGSTAGNTVTTSAVLVPADVSALIGKLGAGYNVQGQTGFVMQNATKWYLRGLPTASAFAFSPTPNDFWGYPVVINDNMSAYTVASASGKSMLYGNWNYYAVVEKPGMVVQRNPFLHMNTGVVSIFAAIFRGGATLQPTAFYYTVGK